MNYSTARSYAIQQDRLDPLANLRDEFAIPTLSEEKECCYFSGNSLGLQPKNCAYFLTRELEQWRKWGSLGHFLEENRWVNYHEQVAPALAKLVGALPSEVIAMNSLTVNLHLMMVSFYRPTKERYKILASPHLFPSDRYALQTQAQFHQFDLEKTIMTLPCDSNGIVNHDDLEELFQKEGKSIALVLIEGVNYFTGQIMDIDRIAALAHQAGALVGFDLAHTIGNCEAHLHNAGVDFAVWCSYKYLNAGPGSVGGCFVHEKHHRDIKIPRFGGWFGHDKKEHFVSDPRFSPMPTVEGWQISNPPILSLAALKASLEIFDKTSIQELRKKSVQLTGYLEFLLRQIDRFTIITPPNPHERGCQLSLSLPQGALELTEALCKKGFICDFRPPHILRLAPVPLYNTFLDVYKLYEVLK